MIARALFILRIAPAHFAFCCSACDSKCLEWYLPWYWLAARRPPSLSLSLSRTLSVCSQCSFDSLLSLLSNMFSSAFLLLPSLSIYLTFALSVSLVRLKAFGIIASLFTNFLSFVGISFSHVLLFDASLSILCRSLSLSLSLCLYTSLYPLCSLAVIQVRVLFHS